MKAEPPTGGEAYTECYVQLKLLRSARHGRRACFFFLIFLLYIKHFIFLKNQI
jgi:hypothetical protein